MVSGPSLEHLEYLLLVAIESMILVPLYVVQSATRKCCEFDPRVETLKSFPTLVSVADCCLSAVSSVSFLEPMLIRRFVV
jgi:hypothetical protein